MSAGAPQQWLDQVQEPAIDPAQPICDPHHHLWDHPGSRYCLDELLADTNSGHNVVATVFVECGAMYRASGAQLLQPVGETEFVNGIAAMSASGGYGPTQVAAGIVGFADLTRGAAVGDALDAHQRVTRRFKGIRHAAGWDASPEIRNSHSQPTAQMLASPQFREGFKELGKRSLVFDCWLYHPQLGELYDLARAFPETTIVLDHFGGPLGVGPYAGQRAEIFTRWREDIVRLAQCPNVVAKLGGLVMAVNGYGFNKAPTPPSSDELVSATQDFYHTAIDAFSPARCMFESNFPVDKVSTSYGVLWNSFKKIAARFSEAEKSAMLCDTAKRVYGLD